MTNEIVEMARKALDVKQTPAPVLLPALLDLARAVVNADAGGRRAASPAELGRARGRYGSDDVEIDDGAHVSEADDGVWVQAWVWLPGTEQEG